MIRFLRHIRQSLILKGQTGKYLKYAVGEIILVVIGILIALQINNWNENRKTTAQLLGYLQSISKNIQLDTIEINLIKNRRERHNKAALDYMECVYKDSMSIDLVNRIAPVMGERYLNVNKTGFEALKSSGFIVQLQGLKLEDALLDYYAFYEEIHESEISLNNFIETMEAGLYEGNYNEISNIFKVFLGDIPLEDMPAKKIKLAAEQFYKNSKMLGMMQRVASEKYFSVYDTLKVKGQHIVTLIDKELKAN
ncbi:hypothetical protein J4050_04975 [Winogradskyella sp. DF17]|uniref:Uncharacterized protein n=1 Tax=Winogradskyella pelagia TaxID=2819984 RepID=A0ABS3T020_9FLAO|nr:hypothetical protein [Winogradskyella sp. DF17]